MTILKNLLAKSFGHKIVGPILSVLRVGLKKELETRRLKNRGPS